MIRLPGSTGLRLFAGFVMAAVVLAAFGSLATSGLLEQPDDRLGAAVRSFETPWLTFTLRILTRLGSTVVLFGLGTVVILVFTFLRKWRSIGLFLIAMAGQAILHHGFKAIFARARPEPAFGYVVNDPYGFPSGHAVASMAFYGMIAWIVTRYSTSFPAKVTIWSATALMILLIGASRVYFGVHYPSDVIGGWAAAAIWVAAVAATASRDTPQTS